MSQPKRGVARPSAGSKSGTRNRPSTDGPPPPPSGQDATAESAAGDSTTAASKDADQREVPMTAADYARTTQGDPASTSVMPAVRDDSGSRGGADARATSQDELQDGSGPRQARLNLVHIDPWSVTKLAFVISVALMIVSVVAVTVFWLVLNVTGVWGSLNETINSVLSSEDGTFDVTDYIGLGRILGLTLVLSAINVLLMTALAAIGARLYNVAAALVGGVQVTFADRS